MFYYQLSKRDRALFTVLWSFLGLEFVFLLLMLYVTSLPQFISLLIFFIQFFTPWLIAVNVVFLIFSIFGKGLGLTLSLWKIYLKELFRFIALSFIIAAAVILVSTAAGTFLGLSVDRLSSLPTIVTMREWVNQHFY